MRDLSDFHEYQHNSVTQLYERSRVLGVIPTGGGKTATALTAFSELQQDKEVRKGLVMSTKSIVNNVWPDEPAAWSHLRHLGVSTAKGGAAARRKVLADDADVNAIGLSHLPWLVEEVKTWKRDDPRFDCFILDEASFIRNPRGSWAKAAVLLLPQFKNVWMLTGTPRANSELDYFVYMKILSNCALWGNSYDKWRREHFYPTDFEARCWHIHRHYIDELNRDVAKYSFRVPLSAVPRPASDPIIHEVELPAAARQQYQKMVRDLYVEAGGDIVLAANRAIASTKLAQIAQGFVYAEDGVTAHHIHNAKSEALVELLNSAGGDAALITYLFKEDLRRLKDLIPGLVVIGGGTSDKRAREYAAEWNAGNIENMALHPAAGGHGLNLQGTPAQLMHYTLTWDSEKYAQVIARVARQGYAGGDTPVDMVLNHHLVAKGTIDEAKMDRVQGKISAEQAAIKYIKSVI